MEVQGKDLFASKSQGYARIKGLCRCRGALIVATWVSYPWLKYDNMNIGHKKQSDMDSTTRRDNDLTISSHVFVLCKAL
uniref:Uncharacterized protein n=1 Tax=Populus trichocarpa TaxID=3694 RepID=A0A2K2AWV7_POPTR